jgi:TRAP-type mannitol/chloroaromatic compound transport system permease small subunit
MRHWLRLARSIDRLNDWIYAAIRWLVLAMIVVGAYNALARYANRWTDVQLAPNALFDLQWYMFSLVFLLGAAYGLNHDVHVRVDVFYARLRPRVRAWIDLLGTALFVIPFSIVVLVVSWPAVRNSWAIREASSDPGGLVRYPIKTVILVCFVLLLLQGIAVVIEKIALLRAGEAGVESMTPTDAGSARRERMEGV